jgi:tetratricopeptide (TPR) repeat protein
MKAFSIAFAVLLLFFCSTALAQQEKLDPTWLEINQKMVEAFGEENLAKAKEYGEKAIEYLKKNNMNETLETATTLNNVGMVYYYSQDLPRAAGYMVQALALRRKLLGPDHMEVGATCRNLAEIYKSQAAIFFNEAERIQALHE